MKITELIKILQTIKKEEGNLEVMTAINDIAEISDFEKLESVHFRQCGSEKYAYICPFRSKPYSDMEEEIY